MDLNLKEEKDHNEPELLTVRKHDPHKAIQVHNKYIVITQYICPDTPHHDTEYQMDECGRQAYDAILTGIINKLFA